MTPLENCSTCTHYDANTFHDDTTDVPLNVPLLQNVLTSIKLNPESWNQLYYFAGPNGRHLDYNADIDLSCGTTMCFAGWAMYLADGPQASRIRTEAQVTSSERGRDLLGLTELEALHLFLHTENNIAEIEEFVHFVTERRGLNLPVPSVPSSVPAPAPAPAPAEPAAV